MFAVTLLALLTSLFPQLPTASTPVHRGVWPLEGRPAVAERFAAPDVRWGPGHRGVDLYGVPGQPVRASMAGTIAFAGTVAGVASVSIDHPDGTRTTHQPVAPGVVAGAEVSAGDVIGVLLPTGSHCAPLTCLHWGWRTGSGSGLVYLDPLRLVALPRVRLLPLTPAGGPDGRRCAADRC